MMYYRCKCGETESYGSMSPYPCSGCDACGTTLEFRTDRHTTPLPHEWVVTGVSTDEGMKPITKCSWCGIRAPITRVKDHEKWCDWYTPGGHCDCGVLYH